MVSDAKTNDIFILPPSIEEMNGETCIIDNRIHFGLTDIKSVGVNQIQKLNQKLKEEEDKLDKKIGEWNWYEFLTRISDKISSPMVIAMVSVGVLSDGKISRNRMLDEFDTWTKLTDKERLWVYDQHSQWDNLKDALIA